MKPTRKTCPLLKTSVPGRLIARPIEGYAEIWKYGNRHGVGAAPAPGTSRGGKFLIGNRNRGPDAGLQKWGFPMMTASFRKSETGKFSGGQAPQR